MLVAFSQLFKRHKMIPKTSNYIHTCMITKQSLDIRHVPCLIQRCLYLPKALKWGTYIVCSLQIVKLVSETVSSPHTRVGVVHWFNVTTRLQRLLKCEYFANCLPKNINQGLVVQKPINLTLG